MRESTDFSTMMEELDRKALLMFPMASFITIGRWLEWGEFLTNALKTSSTVAPQMKTELAMIVESGGSDPSGGVRVGGVAGCVRLAEIRKEWDFGADCQQAVVYGGGKRQRRSDFDLIPWFDLKAGRE